MKRTLSRIKTVLFISLTVSAWAAQSGESLFKASFMKKKGGDRGHLTISTTIPNKTYPYAGILINPNYILSGCVMNPKNHWCLFEVSKNTPKTLVVQSKFNMTGMFNEQNNLAPDNIKVQLSLNAQGNQPISVQSTTVTASESGRVIGYMYGWDPTIPADEIAAAGYTHVLIAFGLFTTTGGGISLGALSGSGFNTQNDLFNYIQSLHEAGLKVLLSIGGASTNIPNTTVSFYTAQFGVGTAPNYNPALFQTNFITALKELTDTYGFDGFDFDIEDGLYAGSNFTNPAENCSMSVLTSGCTSYYLANIINTLYDTEYSYAGNRLMITLAPQLSQISATSTYNSIFGLYSALVMQTYSSLEWIAFQNYNAGCAYGINGVCYPTDGTTLSSSPDSAVAFSTDLLASWPLGTSLGFLPYTGYLNPSQVVIGYVVNNSSGVSDGSPVVNIPVAKNAIQCLRTNENCDTYIPPTTYPGIGGVFSWTINYDASNSYQFAKSLYPCVVEGNCN